MNTKLKISKTDRPQWLRVIETMRKLFSEEGNVYTWVTWLIKIFTFGLKTNVPIQEQLRVERIHSQQRRRIKVLTRRITSLSRKLREKQDLNEKLLTLLEG